MEDRRRELGADGSASYHRRAAGAIAGELVIGLSSGTSMDGIDAALVAFGEPEPRAVELLAFKTYPYADALRAALTSCCRVDACADVARLNVAVGEAFAAAAADLLDRAGRAPEEIHCIGSHGQTLIHLPEPTEIGGWRVSATLQIGELSVIAERTRVTTVGDFRTRDMAAGGEGAPLVPILDHALLTHPERGRVALNIGGIANVTGLPAGASVADIVAFDTGPGNVLLDMAARRHHLAGGIDQDGGLASSGEVSAELLSELMEHPFFTRRPPKSADLGMYSGDFAERCWQAGEALSTADLLRTLAELTARTVADGIERFVATRQAVDEVVVSGGGAHNAAVMTALRNRLPQARVVAVEQVCSIPGDAKEAVLFAYLAHLTMAGRCGNVPAATGAARPVVLGKIVPAP
jgi:anhydro-N-acetylmuramic acid kinase